MLKKYLLISVVMHVAVLSIIAYSTARGQEKQVEREYEVVLSYEKGTATKKQTTKQRTNMSRNTSERSTPETKNMKHARESSVEGVSAVFEFRSNGIKTLDDIDKDDRQVKQQSERFLSKHEIEDERKTMTSKHVIAEGEADEFFLMPSIVCRDVLVTTDFKRRESGDGDSKRQTIKMDAQKENVGQEKKQEHVQIDREVIEDEKVRIYIQRLNSHIGNFSYYPKLAQKRSIQGRNVLNVLLDKKGQIKSIKIIQPSGSDLLDNASIDVVKNASPFPAFPDGLNIESGWITFPFSYILK